MKHLDVGKVVEALGGRSNITTVEACISRVRIIVVDPSKVHQGQLRKLGAMGIVHAGPIVQIVVGPQSDILADKMHDFLSGN